LIYVHNGETRSEECVQGIKEDFKTLQRTRLTYTFSVKTL